MVFQIYFIFSKCPNTFGQCQHNVSGAMWRIRHSGGRWSTSKLVKRKWNGFHFRRSSG